MLKRAFVTFSALIALPVAAQNVFCLDCETDCSTFRAAIHC